MTITANTHGEHPRTSTYPGSLPGWASRVIRDLPCNLSLHDIENSSFEIGPFNIQSRYVIHPGPTVGLRITGKNSVLAYIPDHEPALGTNGLFSNKKWISGIDIISNADLLLHDAQYTAPEYKHKIGWGHSSMEDTIKFAMIAEVKHLLLTHHDPFRTDAQLNEIFSELQKDVTAPFKFELAVEGMEIDLM